MPAAPQNAPSSSSAPADLTTRLLLPGLATLLESEPERNVRVLGAAMGPHPGTVDQAGAHVADQGQGRSAVRDTIWRHRIPERRTCSTRPPSSTSWRTCPRVRPALRAAAAGDDPGMRSPRRDRPAQGLKLALEKPFGFDKASAAKFNRLLTRIVPEEQTFPDRPSASRPCSTCSGCASATASSSRSGTTSTSATSTSSPTRPSRSRAGHGYYDGNGR